MNSLSSQSPALYKQLERLLGDGSELAELSEIYEYSIRNGGKAEVGFERQPGASFNPRPARICTLLIKPGGSRSTELLGTAMLRCAKLPIKDLPERFHQIQEKAIHSPGTLLSGIMMLDDLRHLHLRADREHEKDLLLKRAEALYRELQEIEVDPSFLTIYHKALQRLR